VFVAVPEMYRKGEEGREKRDWIVAIEDICYI